MASVDIPKKYKAVVYDKPGSISTKIEELDMPEPGAGEVLINLYVLPVHCIPPTSHIYVPAPTISNTRLTSAEPTPASATPTWAS